MIRALSRFRRQILPYRRALVLGGLLTVADVGVSLAQPWPMRWVVDGVLRPGAPVENADVRLGVAVATLAALVAAGAIVSYWSTRLLSAAGLHIASDLRVRVMAHLHRLSLRYHGKHRVGDLVSRVTSDVDRTQDMLVQVLATLFPNVLMLSGMAVVMTVVDPMFTALAVASTVPLALATHQSRRQLRDAARASRKADGEMASAATENLGAINLVQAFTLEGDRLKRFSGLSRASLAAGLDAARLQARFGPLVDLAAMLSGVLVLWFGAHRVLDGKLSLGVLLVFISYLSSLFKPIKALSKLSSVVSKGTAAAERVSSLLDTEPEITDRPRARAATLRGAIRFDDVSFSYGREQVLDQLSFQVDEGQTLALVGPTGAGKSTIASLIPRLIDVSSGVVSIDGIDVRDYALGSLRNQMALVLQDSVLLNGTLRDNILCGSRRSSGRDVERAAKLALVDEFASRLPDGLDTRIGDRGANLSGGQRQRIAIARAILRDCPIIILDEPTSALDAVSEELLVEALANLPRGRTTLVIAHRLSTVRRADNILVMNGGRAVEYGTHDQLVAAGGLYEHMSRLQSTNQGMGNVLPPRTALPPPAIRSLA